jgi:hypothetical protein
MLTLFLPSFAFNAVEIALAVLIVVLAVEDLDVDADATERLEEARERDLGVDCVVEDDPAAVAGLDEIEPGLTNGVFGFDDDDEAAEAGGLDEKDEVDEVDFSDTDEFVLLRGGLAAVMCDAGLADFFNKDDEDADDANVCLVDVVPCFSAAGATVNLDRTELEAPDADPLEDIL